jgi:hypothetical protein
MEATSTISQRPLRLVSVKRLTLPLIAVGMLASCGGADTATTSQGTASTTAATSSPAATSSLAGESPASTPANVPEALGFTAPLVGGGEIELTTLAGRPVLLWFWAPW